MSPWPYPVSAAVSSRCPEPQGRFPRVTHPCAAPPEGGARLACVRRAASVRSEPGSNSQLHPGTNWLKRSKPRTRPPSPDDPTRRDPPEDAQTAPPPPEHPLTKNNLPCQTTRTPRRSRHACRRACAPCDHLSSMSPTEPRRSRVFMPGRLAGQALFAGSPCRALRYGGSPHIPIRPSILAMRPAARAPFAGAAPSSRGRRRACR